MIKAYKKFWMNYINFSGRSSRSDYWWVTLCQLIITAPFLLYFFSTFLAAIVTLSPVVNTMTEDQILNYLASQVLTPINLLFIGVLFIYGWLTFIPSLALIIRRLRDAGFHWAFFFISFVPYVGSLVLLILTIMPTKEEQRF